MYNEVWFSEMIKECKDEKQRDYYIKFLQLINKSFKQIYNTYMSECDADDAYQYTIIYVRDNNAVAFSFPKMFETSVVHLMDKIIL